MPPLIGSCLCGAVTITIKDTAGPFGDGLEICNCTDCRQFTGCSRGAEFLECDLENVEVKGDTKCYEKMADTGNSYKRYFCGTCGSSLYDIPGIYGGKKVYPHSGEYLGAEGA